MVLFFFLLFLCTIAQTPALPSGALAAINKLAATATPSTNLPAVGVVQGSTLQPATNAPPNIAVNTPTDSTVSNPASPSQPPQNSSNTNSLTSMGSIIAITFSSLFVLGLAIIGFVKRKNRNKTMNTIEKRLSTQSLESAGGLTSEQLQRMEKEMSYNEINSAIYPKD